MTRALWMALAVTLLAACHDTTAPQTPTRPGAVVPAERVPARHAPAQAQ